MQVTDSVQPELFVGSGKRWVTAHAAMTADDRVRGPGPITGVGCAGNGVVVFAVDIK